MFSRVQLSYTVFFFQAEDGIRDLVRSRGLGDVYKRQGQDRVDQQRPAGVAAAQQIGVGAGDRFVQLPEYHLSLIHI